MIPKISNATLTMTKVVKNPAKTTAVITTGALAVLSTRQAWPYCLGLGPTYPKEVNPDEFEKRIINGHEVFVKKDMDVPSIDIDSVDVQNDLPDVASETEKLHGLAGVIDNTTSHIHDGITHFGEKASDAWDNVKDFFEGLL